MFGQAGINNKGNMKTKDSNRKWMWWFLGVVIALQLYFVRELWPLLRFCAGIRSHSLCGDEPVHDSEGLGNRRSARSRQPEPSYRYGAAWC